MAIFTVLLVALLKSSLYDLMDQLWMRLYRSISLWESIELLSQSQTQRHVHTFLITIYSLGIQVSNLNSKVPRWLLSQLDQTTSRKLSVKLEYSLLTGPFSEAMHYALHSEAFWNSFSQGPGPSRWSPVSAGNQGFCHMRKQRSGWGMIAKCRPFGEHSAAIPAGDPFGFWGYVSVGVPEASQYLRAQNLFHFHSLCSICSYVSQGPYLEHSKATFDFRALHSSTAYWDVFGF